MANDEDPILTQPGSQQMARHVNDYSKFTSLFKWGAISCFVIAILILFIIS